MTGRVRVVGVVGRCCAGKDLATGWFVERGWHEINVDRVGHLALSACRDEVVSAFGDRIVGEDGTIDRRALGAIVFSDRDALARLEAIVHPWMRGRVAADVASLRAREVAGVVINAALLVHMDLHPLCDDVLLVTAPLATRMCRAHRRDGASWRRILARVWAQRRLTSQVRRVRADTINVENGSTPEALYAQLASHFEAGTNAGA